MYIKTIYPVYFKFSVQVDPNDWFWIGAWYVEDYDSWFWIEEPITASLWSNNEPNGGLNENCIEWHKWRRKWNDKPCSNAGRFPLCELP